MSAHTEIAGALATRLSTLSLPTAWENGAFTPTSDVLYLREQYLPAETIPFGLSKVDSNGGIYQVTVMAPKGGTKGPAMTTAKTVAELFPRGLRLTYGVQQVTIKSVSQGPAMDIGDRWAVPVSIRWWAGS